MDPTRWPLSLYSRSDVRLGTPYPHKGGARDVLFELEQNGSVVKGVTRFPTGTTIPPGYLSP